MFANDTTIFTTIDWIAESNIWEQFTSLFADIFIAVQNYSRLSNFEVKSILLLVLLKVRPSLNTNSVTTSFGFTVDSLLVVLYWESFVPEVFSAICRLLLKRTWDRLPLNLSTKLLIIQAYNNRKSYNTRLTKHTIRTSSTDCIIESWSFRQKIIIVYSYK